MKSKGQAIKELASDKYKWHDLRKNPDDLPPSRGDGRFVPDSYELVVICNEGTDNELIIQGQGWLNDVWKDGTGFILIAKQLTSKKLAYYPDEPIEFSYSQLIAWREKEPFEEVEEE